MCQASSHRLVTEDIKYITIDPSLTYYHHRVLQGINPVISSGRDLTVGEL